MLLSPHSANPHLQINSCSLCSSSQWTRQRRPSRGKKARWLTALWVRSPRLWPPSAVYQRLRRPKPPLHRAKKRWAAPERMRCWGHMGVKVISWSERLHVETRFSLSLSFLCFPPTNLNCWTKDTFSGVPNFDFWAIPVRCLASILFTVGGIFIRLYRIQEWHIQMERWEGKVRCCRF